MEKFPHGKSCQALEQAAQEVVESPVLEGFKTYVDVVPGYMVSWWALQPWDNGSQKQRITGYAKLEGSYKDN